MVKHKSHTPARRRLPVTGIWGSDEMIFGLSRGIYPPPHRDLTGRGKNLDQSRASFEATYPKYPFSELVRLGVVFGNWLARMRTKFASTASGEFANDHGKTQWPGSGHFDRQANRSYR